jgi:hypothetical protein
VFPSTWLRRSTEVLNCIVQNLPSVWGPHWSTRVLLSNFLHVGLLAQGQFTETVLKAQRKLERHRMRSGSEVLVSTGYTICVLVVLFHEHTAQSRWPEYNSPHNHWGEL